MLFFIFLSTLALSEAYVSVTLDLNTYQKTYKGHVKNPSATITLVGPIEAHCIHMTKNSVGGTFKQDGFVPMLKMSVAGTVLLDRYLVDDCQTEQKIRESIVKVTPSRKVDKDKLPLRVDIEYRTWDFSKEDAPKQRVYYELKSGVYERTVVKE